MQYIKIKDHRLKHLHFHEYLLIKFEKNSSTVEWYVLVTFEFEHLCFHLYFDIEIYSDNASSISSI